MIEDLATLTTLGERGLWAAFVVFLRVGAMMALVPAFGESSIPARVKLGIALAFCGIVAPAVWDGIGLAGDPVQILRTCGAEVVNGLFFGLMLRFFVFALQTAGAIAAQSTSLSQIFGGTAGADPQPAIGHLLTIGGLALAAILGLHVRLAAYMIDSYNFAPAGRILSAEVVLSAGVDRIGATFASGFSLAAPFVIAALIYNVTLGVINRAMPQLMVSFVGAPAITGGALALMLLAVPLILGVWVGGLNDFMAEPFGGP